MRNRAGKDSDRWCHLTHLFIAGASVYIREPETRVAEVYQYFVSNRFINHSIIHELRNIPGTHCCVPQCINSGNGHVIYKTKTRAPVARHVTSSPRHELKSKFFIIFYFLILCLFDISALLLLLRVPVVILTNLYQGIRVTKHRNLIIEGCYEQMC